MNNSKNKTQLAVIGAGPGGYPAAFLAADLGMEVTLIDPEPNPGGVCLYRGCIPTKTLLHVAEVIREAEEAKTWGVEYTPPHIDIDKIRSWKNRVVQRITGGTGQLTKQRKINYIQGKAKFISNETLHIQTVAGDSGELVFEKAILATGSHPAWLPNIPLDSPRIMNSATAMDLPDIPKSLLVIGGGYIGLEMGTIYATLGSEVTIVEMMPDILPGGDADLVRTYSMTARKRFNAILTGTMVTNMVEVEHGVRVTLKDKDDHLEEKIYEKVLVTIGRKPNSQDLGIENTQVKTDAGDFIKIDSQCRTGDPSIYAIGDVVGGAMLAHKATHEGRTAVRSIMGQDVAFTPKAIPAVLFTDPEVAWCGLTETEATANGQKIQIAKFPWGASGRAGSLGRMDGVTKLIIDPVHEKILGVGLVGPRCGELISEAALAVEMGLKASDLANTIHPHPTLSETLMEAADVFYGHCAHVYRPKK